jgi:hypothetical protein
MNSYISDLSLELFPNDKTEDYFFFNEEIRYKIRKKNRKLKIQFFISEMKKIYNITPTSTITIMEILTLKIFTQFYSSKELIVVNNKIYKIFAMYIITFLKELEEQKIHLIVINIENTEIITILPEQILGKPFISSNPIKNTIINFIK